VARKSGVVRAVGIAASIGRAEAKGASIISAVGTANGTGSAIGEPRAILEKEGLKKLAAGGDMQRGRQIPNQRRRDLAAGEHAQWQAMADAMTLEIPRPTNAKIVGRIAQRTGREKRTIRKWLRLPD
jgi:hypothetical protein